jgi:hypothetical protein
MTDPQSDYVPGRPPPPDSAYRWQRSGWRSSLVEQSRRYIGNRAADPTSRVGESFDLLHNRLAAKHPVAAVATSAAIAGTRGLSAGLKAPQKNVDTEIMRRLSQEGRLTYMGRGVGERNPTMIRTENYFGPSTTESWRSGGPMQNVREAGPDSLWARPVDHPTSMASQAPGGVPGLYNPQQPLRSPRGGTQGPYAGPSAPTRDPYHEAATGRGERPVRPIDSLFPNRDDE